MRGMEDWALQYLRHVLEAKGWTPADLSRLTGLAHSTINRPLNDPKHKSRLSRNTIATIHKASGIDPAPFAHGAAPQDDVHRRPALDAPGDPPFRVTFDGRFVDVTAHVDAANLSSLISHLQAILALMSH